MAVNVDGIPQALRTKARWILWRLEEVDGKLTKVPYIVHPTNANKANVTDGVNWSSFDRALECLGSNPHNMTGIGYCLADDDNKVFFDFDHCISDDGVIDEQVDTLVKELNSYTEVSQSGRGLHVIVGSSAPTFDVRNKVKNHHSNIDYETYYDGRYIAITGSTIPEMYSTEVKDNPTSVEKVWKENFNKSPVAYVDVPSTHDSKTNEELWRSMFSSKSGADIANLFAGTSSSGDDSADDMSLLNHLAFWTGRNQAQMESMFNESALGKRAKWTQRKDYRNRSIERAIQDCVEVYTPGSTFLIVESDSIREVTEEELDSYKLVDGPDFTLNLEPDNFFSQFMGYGQEVSDAYEEYWFAGAVNIVSVLIDKRIVISTLQGDYYTNFYLDILGPSTLARKSTAVDKAEVALSRTFKEDDPLKWSNVPTEFSPEAFVEHMDSYPHSRWVRDESAGVLNSLHKDYMAGFKDIMMTLYDCKPMSRMLRTKRNNSAKTMFKVDDPYLNILWATTVDSFAAATEEIDLTSGFMARFLHFFPNRPKKSWKPISLKKSTSAVDLLIHDVTKRTAEIFDKVQSIGELEAGTLIVDSSKKLCITVEDEAEEFFTAWQEPRDKKFSMSQDHRLGQIYGRLVIMALKLAVLFEVGSKDFDPRKPVLRKKYLEEACRLVDEYFIPTAVAVYDVVGKQKEKNHILKVESVLRTHGGQMPYSLLLKCTNMQARELNESLDTMALSGRVEIVIIKNNGKRKAGKHVRLLNPHAE